MNKKVRILVLLAIVLLSASATYMMLNRDQSPRQADVEKYSSAPEKTMLILDTDLGNSTDDMLAMQAAFMYQKNDKCDVLAFMNSRQLEMARDFADRMLHYYGADGVELGVVPGDNQYFEIVPYYHLCERVGADGSAPLYQGTGIPADKRLEGYKLYRKVLAKADDNSVSIVCVGMLTNLGKLMDSQADEYSDLSGMDLIRRKVKQLDVMGCCFEKVPLRYDNGFLEVEYNIGGDVPLAKHVLEDWPAVLYITPLEVGLDFPSDHELMLREYGKDTLHPMYQIYKYYDEWAKGDVGQYWWDPLCVIHSVEGDSLFSISECGTISILPDGHSVFSNAEEGNVRIVRVADKQKMTERLMSFDE